MVLPLDTLLNLEKAGPEAGIKGSETEEEAARNFDLKLSLERQNLMLEKLAKRLEGVEKKRNRQRPMRESQRDHQPYPYYGAPFMHTQTRRSASTRRREIDKRLADLEKEIEMKNLIKQQQKKIADLELARLMREEKEPDNDIKVLKTLKEQWETQQRNMMQMFFLMSLAKNNNNPFLMHAAFVG